MCNLPISLKKLYCCNNQIIKIENFPPNLELCFCYYNHIRKIENLPIVKYEQFPSLKILTLNYILSNEISINCLLPYNLIEFIIEWINHNKKYIYIKKTMMN